MLPVNPKSSLFGDPGHENSFGRISFRGSH